MYRAKKFVTRLEYDHFVQFDKHVDEMTLEEFDTLKKKFGFVGSWEVCLAQDLMEYFVFFQNDRHCVV